MMPAHATGPAPQLSPMCLDAGQDLPRYRAVRVSALMHRDCWTLIRRLYRRGIRLPVVLYTCPHGHAASLDDHAIDEGGWVMPAVVCRTCGWSGLIRLVDWDSATDYECRLVSQ